MKVYKKFTYDFVWLSFGVQITKHTFETAFKTAIRQLTFRHNNKIEANGWIDVRDVCHCIVPNVNYGFLSKDFLKSTDKCFISGQSHHVRSAHKSIVLGGKAIRVQRLNEREEDELSVTFVTAAGKVFTLWFLPEHGPRHDIIRKRKIRLHSLREKNDDEATSAKLYSSQLKLSQKENNMVPDNMISYKRPEANCTHIANYKTLEHRKNDLLTKLSAKNVALRVNGLSEPYGCCATCDNFGRHRTPMVNFTEILKTPCKTSELGQKLNCSHCNNLSTWTC